MVRRIFVAVSIMAVIGIAAVNAQGQEFDPGKFEYQVECAACHGNEGKGDGPVAPALKASPPDLTVLAKKNNGVFPFNYVYEVIDGRKDVTAHGSREMPVWGNRYMVFVHPSYDAELVARLRILGVIDYLNRIQEK